MGALEHALNDLMAKKFVYQTPADRIIGDNEFSIIKEWASQCIGTPGIDWLFSHKTLIEPFKGSRFFDAINLYQIGFRTEEDYLAFQLKFS